MKFMVELITRRMPTVNIVVESVFAMAGSRKFNTVITPEQSNYSRSSWYLLDFRRGQGECLTL